MNKQTNVQFNQFVILTDLPIAQFIGAKPNLYCKAIELVFGGSPKICGLV